MASIRREVSIDVPAEQLWSALKDVGALHTRLVAGFVTDCQLDGNTRVVTFANGVVARELIVDINDADRRLAWTSVGGRLSHHNAAAQVFAEGSHRCRLVWIADLLPDTMAPAIAAMVEQGTIAMKRTLEAAAEPAPQSRYSGK